jgi:HK97 family phage major capsid protein
MNTRSKIFDKMTMQERSEFLAREDVKAYLGEVRTSIKEKRALTNVGLTIPEVMLGLLRENLINYSKLYRHVSVRPVQGDGRVVIMGVVPEAIWTECCANLNELSLGFNDLEINCYRVAGYFAVCNANIEDSDLDLVAELMEALAQAIGLALDKAILYGRNATTTQRMPQGIVSRLAQTEQPTGYPTTARTWVDLHTTNIKTIPASATGVEFFKALAVASGAAKGAYSRGPKTWVMNEVTYTKLVAEAMAIDAGGAIVSGVNGTMPVLGGDIEVLNFIPDNVIIGGYFDLYILGERRGPLFGTSEHVRFLADQTVLKGTARYDGGPAIAEAFVAVGIGSAPTATMTFAAAGE